MNNKLDSYTPIINSLVSEAIRCSPESWDSGTLRIELSGQYLSYALKNTASAEKAEISPPLRALSEELCVTMHKQRDGWIGATVDFFRKDGNWSFHINFERPTSQFESQPSVEPEAAKKSWWKPWA